ncbi:MAG TPA: mechanosensitive ion channel family protein, partial [Holophaga sp.]|nr:mechanosensitive ion channel family protein [Holophaga sp.]
MAAAFLCLPTVPAELGHTAVTVGLRLTVVLAAFAILAALLRILCRRGAISCSLGGLVKWLAGMGLLWGLEQSLPDDMAEAAARAFTLAYLGLAWLSARHAVDFIYATFLPVRGAGKPGRHILQDLLKFCILAVLAGWGLKELLDIQLGSLLTSSAILTAVIGLSMQDTIGSLFSGLLLQIEKPFEEGDWIKVGDVEGKVSTLTWRYTKVVSGDDNEVLLPNNTMAKERLVNYSRPEPALRQILHVPAPPDAPPVKVKSAILTALGRAEGVARQPAPAVRLHEIQPDRIVYAAAYTVQSFDVRLAAADAVLSAVWYQFLERGIDIPTPARQVFMTQRAVCSVNSEQMEALAGVGLLAGMPEAD